MDIQKDDRLTMKKPHPCGSRDWDVLRAGMDFRIRCCGCGHEVEKKRADIEKNIRKVTRAGRVLTPDELKKTRTQTWAEEGREE